jgi:hypothetical protein
VLAIGDFEQAILLSERMSVVPYVAHSKLGRSQTLGTREPEAGRLRAEAESIGSELGMPRLMRDAERSTPS